MSGDKRSVATDALEVLGNKITDKKVGRDAVHLACLPVISADDVMRPGEHIGILPNGKASANAVKKIGIADPFINGWIKEGDEILLIVYPRKIESLRHVWSHPDIPNEVVDVDVIPKYKSNPKELLIEIAHKVLRDSDNSYGDEEAYGLLIDGMDDGYIQDGGAFEGMGVAHIPDEAWDLFEEVIGRRARAEVSGREVYFSCSC